ncbi:hypothetical protein EPUS_08037 [Endocarpon pusillum Z07020]|uniref:Prolyl 4-hydroxylase alpha subunit domain-containing protein n=1 Tax=Endocarpon pusillum (strain Z07020 / HMAS-L-300199) TaxID=1263415 RepID=U1GDP2_ENDPU|nr:uncharacterized protein EPUS_08037 [Endocarpon pusillum Z07020]ERF69836.1 hypothetical protein EPUS_08037 [Endocarpon pusillum Z07020]
MSGPLELSAASHTLSPPTTDATTPNSEQLTTSSLPADQSRFLSTPSPPTCTSTVIDFSTTPLPEYANHFALLISNLLTASECAQLLQLAESTTRPPATWSAAEINIGYGRQMLMREARNCGRIIWDSHAVAQRLMHRIRPHLPAEIVTVQDNARITGYGPVKRGETWRVSRLNERLRFLRYEPGMYFREHCDGCYVTPDGREISWLTVHVYLNGGEEGSEDAASSPCPAEAVQVDGGEVDRDPATATDAQKLRLKGGATRFFSPRLSARDKTCFDVNPRMGACLVFQHKGLVHSGEEVEQGVKYTVRSDVMYEKV